MGNDIVDLAEAENIGKSRDELFCRRVFNLEELSMIAGSVRPDSFLWGIWAAKEAAYKAISRSDPTVCSIPKKYPVIIEAESVRGISICLEGKVATPRGELTVNISMDEDMVYAVATRTAEALRRVVSRVERVDPAKDDSSDILRKILLEEIANRLGFRTGDLSIVKEKCGPGAPFIIFRRNRLPAEISLSHDGRFIAFAFDPETF